MTGQKVFLTKNAGDRLATIFYLVKGLCYRWFTGKNFWSKYSVESIFLAFFSEYILDLGEKMKFSKLMEDKSLHSCIRSILSYPLGCVSVVPN